MAQAEKDTRIIVKGDKARAKLLEGASAVYDTVTTTFGAKGRNVLIEKPYGRPILTRDGVTVAKDTYFKDRAKNMGAQLVLEASETTNRISGDGTSATVALTYHLLKNGIQAIAAGQHPMDIKQQYFDDSYVILDRLSKLSKKAKLSQLKEVASTSCGDPILGQLIAEAIERVGQDGGVLTELSHVADVEREFIDGYYLQMGFEGVDGNKSEFNDPFVIVSKKRLTNKSDAFEILRRTFEIAKVQPGQITNVIFIGNFEDSAYQLLINNIDRTVAGAVIKAPMGQFGNMATEVLDDIAVAAGCLPIEESDNIRNFDKSKVGAFNKAVITKNESTFFFDSTESIQIRVSELKDRLETETIDAIAEKLRDRISKLEGKVAMFKIGGAVDTEKEEKEFRVDDAIQATRAAFKYGVVPGGGTTWLELSKCKVSKPYSDALQAIFKKLLRNAHLPVDVKLNEAMQAPYGQGFNLKSNDTLVNMIEAGILDPTLVLEQVIKNATSIAADALTTEKLLIYEDMPVK